MVYFGSTDQMFYAVDQSTGALVWNYTTNDAIYGSPVVGLMQW